MSGDRVATLPLVPAVVDAVAPIPVVAAGGIADGRGMAAALVLGAAGVWIGTRFLASKNRGASGVQASRSYRAAETDTAHTTLFEKAAFAPAPSAPKQHLRELGQRRDGQGGGTAPAKGTLSRRLADGTPALRYADWEPVDRHPGQVEAMALYAGTERRARSRVKPAAEIVRNW